MRRTLAYAAMTKDEAQRSIRTFYEAVKNKEKIMSNLLIEYESGVVWDLKEAIERLAPTGIPYRHDAKWGDGNGYAHVRAALLGASLTVPLINSRLVLGTWQQIVLVDFDNEPRDRKVLGGISGSYLQCNGAGVVFQFIRIVSICLL